MFRCSKQAKSEENMVRLNRTNWTGDYGPAQLTTYIRYFVLGKKVDYVMGTLLSPSRVLA